MIRPETVKKGETYDTVDFLFLKDGAPLLAVMILTKQRYNHAKNRRIRSYLPKIGIPVIVFLEEMPNYETYVTCRVQDYLTCMEHEVARVARL